MSNTLTIDFETYYDKKFSLSKLTTEEYVRDSNFEVIGVSVQINDNEPEWCTGSFDEIKSFLDEFEPIDIAIAHNAMFDAAILAWKFNIYPKMWVDTLSMARAAQDTLSVSLSLGALSEHYKLGRKGTEVLDAVGKRRVTFRKDELDRYAEYCCNDVRLTYRLYKKLEPLLSQEELKLISLTIKMFSEPVLNVNVPALQTHLKNVRLEKQSLLDKAATDKELIMSNDKFAKALLALGINPPRKISARTGKEAWAFAKSDQEFLDLLEHEDIRVQNLVSARLGVKTTIEETRTERFIGIGKRGNLPVPLRYYAAHTGRWGGTDKINLQNLPSRDNKSAIKKSIVAPEGYTLINCDSSQIEARTLAWFAMQTDLIKAFAEGKDVYKIMAAKIYNKKPEDITKEERFFGKTVILGCGYGMGHVKFQIMLKLQNIEIDEVEAERIIKVYRTTYPMIPNLWYKSNDSLDSMLMGNKLSLGRPGIIELCKNGFVLPNKLKLLYHNLKFEQVAKPNFGFRNVYTYDRTKREKGVYIYGGKIVENIVQALARCIVAEQILRVSEKYKVVLTVHDAVVCSVRDKDLEEAKVYVEKCMKYVPSWAEGLPIDCEIGVGKTYAEC
tara:strand:- start:2414 stop:4252 length:1839 start_codon:yes stop_codon:yes gene_type:complete